MSGCKQRIDIKAMRQFWVVFFQVLVSFFFLRIYVSHVGEEWLMGPMGEGVATSLVLPMAMAAPLLKYV